MGKKGPLCLLVLVLLLAGGLNWGLVGLGGFLGKDLNVLNMLLGSVAWLENGVYVLVGLAALYKLVRVCTGGHCGSMPPQEGGSCCGGGQR